MKDNIRAIVFDFDNTLYDESEYFKVVINAFCDKKGLSKEMSSKMLEHLKKVRPSSKNIFKDLLNPFDLYSPSNSDLFFEFYTSITEEIPLFADTLDILHYVREKGITSVLLTNGLLAAQENKLRNANIAHLFDYVFFARMFGKEFEKPHERIYNHIEQEIGIPASESMFIGDNLKTDFHVPHEKGGVTVFMNSEAKPLLPKPKFITFEVHQLNELKSFI